MKTVVTVVCLWSLTLPATALALATEMFGNAPAANQPDWAAGVIDVVNLESRVYGQWVNGNENFFYRGNAKSLNEAIRKFAAIKDDLRTLIVLPGSGKTHSFARKAVDFDWQLHVPSGIYRAVSKRKHAVMTVYINALKPRPRDRKEVAKWLGDLQSDTFLVREAAKKELQKLGQDAKPFLREALQAKLGLEGRRRIEALLEALRDFDVTDLEIPKGVTVVSVADLLANRGKELKDPDANVRGLAIQDLSGFAPYSGKVVPAMIERFMDDKEEQVRRIAVACLAQLGPQARAAAGAFKQGLNDPDAYIRKTCNDALESLEHAKEVPGHAERIQKELAILKQIDEYKKATRGDR